MRWRLAASEKKVNTSSRGSGKLVDVVRVWSVMYLIVVVSLLLMAHNERRRVKLIRKRNGLLLSAMALILCSLCGCVSESLDGGTTVAQKTEPNPPHLPTTEADIRGTITDLQRIRHNNGQEETQQRNPEAPVSSEEGASSRTTSSGRGSEVVIGVVLVEENPDEEHGSQKDSVTILKGTRLFEQREQVLVSADLEDFEIGQQVRAWYTGPVAESYPRQATASIIAIESQGKME